MENRQRICLGEITKKIGSGATPTGGKESYKDSGIPLIRSQNIYNNGFSFSGLAFIDDSQAKKLNNVIVEANDVLLNITGDSIARSCQAPSRILPARVNQHVAIIRPNTDILFPRYLRFVMVSQEIQEIMLSMASSGATRDALTKEMIGRITIPVPPLPTQKAIAHILGTIDDKIELLRSTNETLEAMARSLFKSWFIDFDPVRKKAEGQPTGLPPEIDALFPDSFEDSELGEIPKGWEVSPFSSQIELIGGGTPKTSIKEYWEGDIPWFTVVDSPRPQDIFVIDTEKHITQEAIDNSSTRLLPAGTTIISARGTVGNLALTATPMCMNQSCYGVRSTIPSGDAYTYFALNNIVQSLKGMAHGSVFDTITRSTFDSATACVPSPTLIQAYGAITDPILSQVRCNLYEIQSLTLGRNALLPKLISGEIELSDKDISKIMEPTK